MEIGCTAADIERLVVAVAPHREDAVTGRDMQPILVNRAFATDRDRPRRLRGVDGLQVVGTDLADIPIVGASDDQVMEVAGVVAKEIDIGVVAVAVIGAGQDHRMITVDPDGAHVVVKAEAREVVAAGVNDQTVVTVGSVLVDVEVAFGAAEDDVAPGSHVVQSVGVVAARVNGDEAEAANVVGAAVDGTAVFLEGDVVVEQDGVAGRGVGIVVVGLTKACHTRDATKFGNGDGADVVAVSGSVDHAEHDGAVAILDRCNCLQLRMVVVVVKHRPLGVDEEVVGVGRAVDIECGRTGVVHDAIAEGEADIGRQVRSKIGVGENAVLGDPDAHRGAICAAKDIARLGVVGHLEVIDHRTGAEFAIAFAADSVIEAARAAVEGINPINGFLRGFQVNMLVAGRVGARTAGSGGVGDAARTGDDLVDHTGAVGRTGSPDVPDIAAVDAHRRAVNDVGGAAGRYHGAGGDGDATERQGHIAHIGVSRVGDADVIDGAVVDVDIGVVIAGDGQRGHAAVPVDGGAVVHDPDIVFDAAVADAVNRKAGDGGAGHVGMRSRPVDEGLVERQRADVRVGRGSQISGGVLVTDGQVQAHVNLGGTGEMPLDIAAFATERGHLEGLGQVGLGENDGATAAVGDDDVFEVGHVIDAGGAVDERELLEVREVIGNRVGGGRRGERVVMRRRFGEHDRVIAGPAVEERLIRQIGPDVAAARVHDQDVVAGAAGEDGHLAVDPGVDGAGGRGAVDLRDGAGAVGADIAEVQHALADGRDRRVLGQGGGAVEGAAVHDREITGVVDGELRRGVGAERQVVVAGVGGELDGPVDLIDDLGVVVAGAVHGQCERRRGLSDRVFRAQEVARIDDRHGGSHAACNAVADGQRAQGSADDDRRTLNTVESDGLETMGRARNIEVVQSDRRIEDDVDRQQGLDLREVH